MDNTKNTEHDEKTTNVEQTQASQTNDEASTDVSKQVTEPMKKTSCAKSEVSVELFNGYISFKVYGWKSMVVWYSVVGAYATMETFKIMSCIWTTVCIAAYLRGNLTLG
jgi:hypothetical protein